MFASDFLIYFCFFCGRVSTIAMFTVSGVSAAVCSTRWCSIEADGNRDLPSSRASAPPRHHGNPASQLCDAAVAVSDGQCSRHGGCHIVRPVTACLCSTHWCHPRRHLELAEEPNDRLIQYNNLCGGVV